MLSPASSETERTKWGNRWEDLAGSQHTVSPECVNYSLGHLWISRQDHSGPWCNTGVKNGSQTYYLTESCLTAWLETEPKKVAKLNDLIHCLRSLRPCVSPLEEPSKHPSPGDSRLSWKRTQKAAAQTHQSPCVHWVLEIYTVKEERSLSHCAPAPRCSETAKVISIPSYLFIFADSGEDTKSLTKHLSCTFCVPSAVLTPCILASLAEGMRYWGSIASLGSLVRIMRDY